MPRGDAQQRINFKSVWPLLIPILLSLTGIFDFAYPSQHSAFANISDLSISHYPNALFLQRSILEYGQIPLWSPTILSGYPFAANPLSGLWYPPGWLALLMPLPFGFNVVVILHLLVAGLGMYLLVRALGRSHEAALFAALAFEAMPKIFADYGAGHLTMVYAISLTPWLLLSEVRGWQRSGSFWLRKPGIVLALITLADPRWAVYAGLLWVAIRLIANPQAMLEKMIGLAKQIALALALAAPLLIPMIEYTQLSTRHQLTTSDIFAFSFPFSGLLGLLAPQYGGFHEWAVYVGIAVFFLSLLAIVRTMKTRLDWLWIGIAVFGFLFSFGQNIPWLESLANLPGFSLLRVPPRILPIVAMAGIILAANSLDDLIASKWDSQTWRRARLAFVAIVGLQAGLVLISWLITKGLPSAFLAGLVFSVAFLLLLHLLQSKRISPHLFWIFLLLLSLVDLGLMDVSLFASRNPQTVLAEGGEAAAFLSDQPGQFRVYSPSYSLPQQTAAAYGLELADGVDPLQLQSYANYMEAATGVESHGYSVTLPALTNDPSKDNEGTVPDVNKLALLNVKFVTSEFEIHVRGLDLVDMFGSTYVYELSGSLPRAYIESTPDKQVIIDSWSPNRIEITASGPGRLVLSEIMYPGWLAQVDGRQTTIIAYEGILRSVELPDGAHQIVFEFRPTSAYIGLALFTIGVSILIFASRRKRLVK
jgi:hypothetical protein